MEHASPKWDGTSCGLHNFNRKHDTQASSRTKASFQRVEFFEGTQGPVEGCARSTRRSTFACVSRRKVWRVARSAGREENARQGTCCSMTCEGCVCRNYHVIHPWMEWAGRVHCPVELRFPRNPRLSHSHSALLVIASVFHVHVHLFHLLQPPFTSGKPR